jgi:hypothetical protein
MSRAARTAQTRSSPTIAAVTATAPSARAPPRVSGSRPSCCRCHTCPAQKPHPFRRGRERPWPAGPSKATALRRREPPAVGSRAG